jgi:hypothetical protein
MSVTYCTVSVHFGFANLMLKPCDRTGWSSSRWCRSILHRRASRRRIRSRRESRGVVGSSAAAAAREDPSGGAVAGGDRATIGAEPTDASADVRNRMPVSLRGGGGELGNLKP